MNSTHHLKTLTTAALLTAIGILIPMIMPIRVIIGPASYTLGSHIPVIIAMFISPFVAGLVAFGTTLGFQMAGFPLVIVLRALSHLIFAYLGARFLQANQLFVSTYSRRFVFSLGINCIHALGEVGVVYLLTTFGMTPQSDHYFYTLFVLVGIGTIIHGMVDFELSYLFSQLLATRMGRRFTDIVKV